MTLIQALARNVGTYAVMLRELPKWKTHKGVSTNAWHRGGLIRSSDEVDESLWSKGIKLSVLLVSQPETGGAN